MERAKELLETTAKSVQQAHDVGTGGAFQTPSLVGVAERDPWLHDGCAGTLEEAIDACGAAPGRHGEASSLTVAGRGDLVSYLRSL